MSASLVGSEMCIRDRFGGHPPERGPGRLDGAQPLRGPPPWGHGHTLLSLGSDQAELLAKGGRAGDLALGAVCRRAAAPAG
eukprot:9857782-Alexandrium_andersonii.AAC.1